MTLALVHAAVKRMGARWELAELEATVIEYVFNECDMHGCQTSDGSYWRMNLWQNNISRVVAGICFVSMDNIGPAVSESPCHSLLETRSGQQSRHMAMYPTL